MFLQFSNPKCEWICSPYFLSAVLICEDWPLFQVNSAVDHKRFHTRHFGRLAHSPTSFEGSFDIICIVDMVGYGILWYLDIPFSGLSLVWLLIASLSICSNFKRTIFHRSFEKNPLNQLQATSISTICRVVLLHMASHLQPPYESMAFFPTNILYTAICITNFMMCKYSYSIFINTS